MVDNELPKEEEKEENKKGTTKESRLLRSYVIDCK